MMPAFTRKTAPTFSVVSLEDLKLHLRVAHDHEDGLLASYRLAAEQWVEEFTGRSIRTQTWQLALPWFVSRLWLPRAAPLQSVTFVKYYDTSNVLTTLDASTYLVPAFEEPAVVDKVDTATWPAVYPRRDAVRVEYVAGYTEGECPAPLILAVQTLVAHFYENRESVLIGAISKEVEFATTALCSPYRVWWRGPEC
jgi:uncharacterized phiE125 gp8 family phage protein